MSQLFLSLPPFAPDYSGVCSLLYDMGGLIVINDPSGCIGNYTGCDEPRWYANPKSVYSSFLREIDVVLGNDSAIIGKVVRTADELKPKFIALLGTPVTAITGIDVFGIAKEIERITDIPSFGVNTDGFSYYDQGIAKVLKVMFEKFAKKDILSLQNSVNLIGVTPLDYYVDDINLEIDRIVEECDYVVNGYIGERGSFKDFGNILAAQKNLVFTSGAIPLVKEINEKYNIPYLAVSPIGQTGRDSIKDFLSENISGYENVQGKDDKILIVGEQVMSNSLREMLIREFGYKNISVGTFFTLNNNISNLNDIYFNGEQHFRDWMKSNNYDVVIGDKIFKSLCKSKFISISHPAGGSKIYWNRYVSVCGNDLKKYFEENGL